MGEGKKPEVKQFSLHTVVVKMLSRALHMHHNTVYLRHDEKQRYLYRFKKGNKGKKGGKEERKGVKKREKE
jgi:hypothetical protein